MAMERWVLVLLLAASVADVADANVRCPVKCLCFRTTVRCMFLQLEKVPPVPFNTTILDLRFNRIRDIEPNTFQNLKNLNTLLLNNNHIHHLRNGAFNGLKELRYLYLYKNRIRQIENRTFVDLPRLEQLYLHFNHIEDLEAGTFSEVPSLERLFLHNNKLQRIPSGAFRNMESLLRLRLDSNALICDCQMLWLAQMLNEKQGTTLAAATCEYPAKLHGKPVSSLVDNFTCKKPILTEEPSDVEISFGGTVYFACKAEGDPDPEIIWLYNSNEIGADSERKYQVLQDGTLMIENASDSDMGSYECMAKSPAGQVKSRLVKMIPSAPGSAPVPASTSTPAPVPRSTSTAPPTSPAAPRSVAVPRSAPRSAPGSAVGATPRIVPGAALRAVPGSAPRSVVTKPTATKVKPRFVHLPEDVDVVAGSPAQLTCEVTGNPTPEISWTFNDGPVNVASDRRLEMDAAGRLRIAGVTERDAGTYRCTAGNSLGKITAAAQLRVLNAPVFIDWPRDQTAFEEATVEFACAADGYPSPGLVWTKDGQPLTPDGRTSIGLVRIRIERVRQSDQGRYKCTIDNVVATLEAEAILTVLSATPTTPATPRTTPAASSSPSPRRAPFFLRTPESAHVTSGQTVRLSCAADGHPTPTILWRRDGEQLRQSTRLSLDGSGDLTLRNVTDADDGTYECTALNDMGVIVARAQLQITESPQRFVSDRVLLSAVEEARRAVDRAVNETIASLFSRDRSSRLTHSQLMRINRFPSAGAREIARAAEVYERALAVIRRHVENGVQFTLPEFTYENALSGAQLQLVANASGCLNHRVEPDCSNMCFHKKYRNVDGTCNNLQKPLVGSSLSAFKRVLPAAYENGFNLPVGWSRNIKYEGFSKPSARLVSTRAMSTNEVTSDEVFTHMLMQWGQFLDHDIVLAVPGMAGESFGEQVNCRTSCDYAAPCFPIEIPPNDVRIRHHRCMEFVRNSAVCGSGATSILVNKLLPREQINHLTSYIDASQVYGSTEQELRQLREHHSNSGLLRSGVLTENGKTLMPFATPNTPMDCKRDRTASDIGCFLAGDVRANEQTGLLVMHTLWFREHNRIAAELRRLNAHWDGDTVFHESRKIVGAVMQHITYVHWLPHIIGDNGMTSLGAYKGYDPNIDASISNVFATAALRMGHALIQPVLQRLNASFLPDSNGHLLLQDAFFAPWRIVEEGGIDPILRGLFASPAKARLAEQQLNANLTENLFRPAHLIAQDLAALNIQRGRDHGLASYNEFRRHCRLKVAETFDDLSSEIQNRALRKKLEQLYGHPSNIDVWVGGMAEDPVDGAKVGPTFRCLMVEQFRRLRDGDRFWYENPGVFKPEQLTQIRQVSLGRIICDSGDNIEEVTNDVFKLPSLQTPVYVRCREVPKVDLRFWTECCQDCSNSGQFQTLGRRGRRSVDQSFPEDNPQHPLHVHHAALLETSNDGDFLNNSIVQDRSSGRPSLHVIDDDRHIETEQQDERIEGLEATVAKMQRTLKRMARKLKQVEALCQQKKAPKSGSSHRHRRPTSNCVDSDGVLHLNGVTWEKDNCTECNCQSGFIRCTMLQCPTCDNPLEVDGECCPLCDVE